MGKPSKHDRQAARARDSVKASLARGRADEAADALLQLPREQREFALHDVARAIAPDLMRAFERRDQRAQHAWLGRMDREPRLLALLDEHERALAARWCLFTATLRARDWPRAEKLWSMLRPELAAQGNDHANGQSEEQQLCAPLDALVSTRGRPAADVLARFEAEAVRMGYDAQQQRLTHVAPATLAEVESCCMRCFDSEPWPRFRDITLGWLRSCGPEIARALRVLCAELSERELLTRSRAGTGGMIEVARCIAGLANDAGAPAELEPLVALSLRTAVRALHAPPPTAIGFDALLTIARAAFEYSALRPLLAASVLGLRLASAQADTRLELLRLALAADSGERTLVGTAIALHADAGIADGEGPAWFLRAIEQALTTPARLASALQRAVLEPSDERSRKEQDCAEPCHALLELLPVELGVSLIDQLWDHLSEPLRKAASEAAEMLVERMRTPSAQADIGFDAEEFHETVKAIEASGNIPRTAAELRAMLRSQVGQQLMQALSQGGPEPRRLRDSSLPLFGALAARVAPYSASVLEVALSLANSKAERARLVRSQLALTSTLLDRLLLLRSAVEEGHDNLSAVVEDLLLDNLSVTAPDAARAVRMAEFGGAPRRVINQVARALLEAVEREPESVRMSDVAAALALARRRVRARKPRKTKTKSTKPRPEESRQATPESRPTARSSRRAVEVSEQLELSVQSKAEAADARH